MTVMTAMCLLMTNPRVLTVSTASRHTVMFLPTDRHEHHVASRDVAGHSCVSAVILTTNLWAGTISISSSHVGKPSCLLIPFLPLRL